MKLIEFIACGLFGAFIIVSIVVCVTLNALTMYLVSITN